MDSLIAAAALAAAAAWAAILLLPWQPHRNRERLEAAAGPADLRDVAVLIPARNEARHLERVLRALARQGPGLDVLVVDDESTDATAEVCRRLAAELAADTSGFAPAVGVLAGAPLPAGWAGKLWALHQGAEHVARRYTLLLDADIELEPHVVPALLAKARQRRAALVSVMAELNCRHFWERLLVPAFVFFFKLLYPFGLVESGRRAGAAGGCMLVETAALRSAGGFAALRAALIDDCTLASLLRRRGCRLSLSMSRSVRSLREYGRLADFWAMVSRTAFTQLGYSALLLAGTSAVLLVVFFGPLAALAAPPSRWIAGAGLAGLGCMCAAYWPVVRFYRLSALRTATLPVAGALFLAMTLTSAINYWSGTRARWKERSYEASVD